MNNTIIIHTETKEQDNTIESLYSPDFVAKIEKSNQDFEEGNYSRVEKKDLKKFLGLLRTRK